MLCCEICVEILFLHKAFVATKRVSHKILKQWKILKKITIKNRLEKVKLQKQKRWIYRYLQYTLFVPYAFCFVLSLKKSKACLKF